MLKEFPKIFIFHLKKLFLNPYIYLLLLFPILFSTFTMTLAPSSLFYAGTFSGSLLISFSVIFFYLKKNQEFTINFYSSKKRYFWISFLMNLYIYEIFVFSFIMSYIFIMNEFDNFFIKDIPFFIQKYKNIINLKIANYLIVFYYFNSFFLINLLIFSIFYSFNKKVNNYFFVSFSYVIITLFFGGVLIPFIYIDIPKLNNYKTETQNLNGYLGIKENLNVYQKTILTASFLCPHFGINQLFYFSLSQISISDNQGIYSNLDVNILFFNFKNSSLFYVFMQTWVWVFILITVKIYKKK